MRIRDFVLIRALMMLPMVLVLVTIVFLVMRVVPGDPVVALMGARAGSEQQINIIRHSLGLDKPLYIQYFEYMGNLLRGDFGYSLVRQRPVIEELLSYFPATLELTIWSALLGIPSGVYLGICAARREGGKIDTLITTGALVRWCIPIFWLGTILQVLVVQYAPVLPLSDRISPQITLTRITGLYLVDSIITGNVTAFFDTLRHLLLPVVTLGTTTTASVATIARANLVEVQGEEYVKIARLKGCTENQVFRKHILPNALIPILTYAGLEVAILMQGAVLTETVFSWPGLGRLLLFAVGFRDFNLIQGSVVFFALIMGLVNLLVDISYALVDPRVRY